MVKKEEMNLVGIHDGGSDVEADPNTIIEHKLTWHSKGENYLATIIFIDVIFSSEFISRLDDRCFQGRWNGSKESA